MKKTVLLILTMILSFSTTWAQRNQIFALAPNDSYSGEAVNVFDLRDKKDKLGSVYWNDLWADGSVKLIGGKTVNDMPLKYDLQANGLEIKVKNDIKVLPGDMIEEFIISYVHEGEEAIRHHFIRLDLFFDKDIIDHRFYELLQEGGKLNLLRKTELETLQPNYVTALDAGSVKAKILKKEKLMVFDGARLIVLPRGKKKKLKILENYKAGISGFYEESGLKHQKMEDLVRMIQYANS